LVASVEAPFLLGKARILRSIPWLMLFSLALCLGAFSAFLFFYGDMPNAADFENKSLGPVAVRLIAPPKPEEKKKAEEKLEKIKKVEKKKVVEKPKSAPTANTKKALKAVEKLTAAPAMKQLLAAVDKMGAGLGSLKVKNDAKISGLLGKTPVSNSGLGNFGLGGGGGSTKGSELLKGGGIGALGLGSVGKGTIGGTVTRAVARNIGAQGSIDREAVAKVINSHLGEVSACYERALLKTPGLSGKIQLEWQITTSGTVGFAKTKTSSLQSPAVEACILQAIKSWKFPAAQGAGVLITYPFMFNSVGY
jgi:outer membrane biosynthesis protein TonB